MWRVRRRIAAGAYTNFFLRNYAFEEGGARDELCEAQSGVVARTASVATSPIIANGAVNVTAATAGAIPTCAIWQIRQAPSCRVSLWPCAVICRKNSSDRIASPIASGLANRFPLVCATANIETFGNSSSCLGPVAAHTRRADHCSYL